MGVFLGQVGFFSNTLVKYITLSYNRHNKRWYSIFTGEISNDKGSVNAAELSGET